VPISSCSPTASGSPTPWPRICPPCSRAPQSRSSVTRRSQSCPPRARTRRFVSRASRRTSSSGWVRGCRASPPAGRLAATPPAAGPDAEGRLVGVAENFLERVGARMPGVIAVGPPAEDIAGIAQARAVALRVLRVLRDGPGSRAARMTEVQTASLLLELRDLVLARGDAPDGALARLIDYDRRNDGHLVDTLRAWLDHFGDVGAAAAATYVHHNTFRYRLRRVREVGGLDLSDAETRFAAMLQLRMLGG